MTRPRLLDAFCCEGGAGMGYHRAGWDVVGVDLEPKFRRRYPYEFVAGDAVQYIRDHGHEFDAVHASPPCQHASVATSALDRSRYPRLIEPTRDALVGIGRPYVIENVEGARASLIEPVMLCGRMFRLGAIDDDGTPLVMERHRLFESNVALVAPPHPAHGGDQVAGSYGGARSDKHAARRIRKGGYVPAKAVQEQMLGIDWMTLHGLHQSLPPVYTQYLGAQLMAAVVAGQMAVAA